MQSIRDIIKRIDEAINPTDAHKILIDSGFVKLSSGPNKTFYAAGGVDSTGIIAWVLNDSGVVQFEQISQNKDLNNDRTYWGTEDGDTRDLLYILRKLRH